MILLPRLPAVVVQQLHVRVRQCNDVEEIRRDYASVRHDAVEWGATGGRRVEDSWLEETAAGVRDIARALGYPVSGNTNTRRQFDVRVAVYLHQRMHGVVPEVFVVDGVELGFSNQFNQPMAGGYEYCILVHEFFDLS